VRNRTVAVLYADSAGLDSEAINLEALETLVRVAAMAVDLLAVRSAAARPAPAPEPQIEETPVEEVRQPEPESYTPVAEYDEITPVVEESAPAAEVHDLSGGISGHVEVEPETIEPQPETIETSPDTQQFEMVTQPRAIEVTPEQVAPESETFEVSPAQVEASRAPEPAFIEAAPPAVEVPVEITSQPGTAEAPPETPRRRYGTDVELPVNVASEDERRLHNDARRFARLLVSEIKLYNEHKVAEGRSQNDLYLRLREYIDRSREMYDKRVKPEVAERYDYFHQELITTLAEGDAAKLGSDYPGAAMSVET
jgi:hypothetical protein